MLGMLLLVLMAMLLVAARVCAIHGSQGKRFVSLLLCIAMMSSYMPSIHVAKAQTVSKPVLVNEQVLVNGLERSTIGAVTYHAVDGQGAYALDDSSSCIRVRTDDQISFKGTISAPEGENISWVRVDVYDATTDEPYTVGAEYYRADSVKAQTFDLANIPALTIGEAFGRKNYTLTEGGKYIVMFCVGDSNGNTFADKDINIEDEQGPAILVDVKFSPANCKHPHSSYEYVQHSSGEIRKADYGDSLTHQVEPLYERYCGLCGTFLMNIWGEGSSEEHIMNEMGVCLECGYSGISLSSTTSNVITIDSHQEMNTVDVGDIITVTWTDTGSYAYVVDTVRLDGEPNYSPEDEPGYSLGLLETQQNNVTFSVSNIDAGKYTKVTIYGVDENGNLTHEPDYAYFYVQGSDIGVPTLSNFSVSPEEVSEGQSFAVYGTVQGNGNYLKVVRVSIWAAEDETLGGCLAEYNDLNQLNFELGFAYSTGITVNNMTIGEGKYIVEVTAEDENGNGFEQRQIYNISVEPRLVDSQIVIQSHADGDIVNENEEVKITWESGKSDGYIVNAIVLNDTPAYTDNEAGIVLEKDLITSNNSYTFTSPWVNQTIESEKWVKISVYGINGENGNITEMESTIYLKIVPIQNDFSYTIDEFGNAIIGHYNGTETDLSVPSEIDGRTVIGIGVDAFRDSEVKNLHLPSSVTSIGYSAFSNSSLNSVNIPEGVTEIPQSAFHGCSYLTSVSLPSSITSIGAYAFYMCNELTEITLPDSVRSIGEYAFHTCRNASGLKLPSSLLSISTGAFQGSGISEITIPSGLQSIPDLAFRNCENLKGTHVSIPGNISSIGNEAFNGTKLSSITVPANVTSIGTDAFSQKALSLGKGLKVYGYIDSAAHIHSNDYHYDFIALDSKENGLIVNDFELSNSTVETGNEIYISGTVLGIGVRINAVSIAIRDAQDETLGGYIGRADGLNTDSYDLSSLGKIIAGAEIGNTIIKPGEYIIEVYATDENGNGLLSEENRILTVIERETNATAQVIVNKSYAKFNEGITLEGTVKSGDYCLKKVQVSVFTDDTGAHGYYEMSKEFAYEDAIKLFDLTELGEIVIRESFMCNAHATNETFPAGEAMITVYVSVYGPNGEEDDNSFGASASDSILAVKNSIYPWANNAGITNTSMDIDDPFQLSGEVCDEIGLNTLYVYVYDSNGKTRLESNRPIEGNVYDLKNFVLIPGVDIGWWAPGSYSVSIDVMNSHGKCFVNGPVHIGSMTVSDQAVCDHSGKNYRDEYDAAVAPKVTDNGNGTHLIQNSFKRYCEDCGEYIGNVWETGKSEPHIIENNECTICDYIEELICSHSSVTWKEEKTYEQLSTDTAEYHTHHTIVVTKYAYCNDCDVTESLDTLYPPQEVSWNTELHQLTDGDCLLCGYESMFVPDQQSPVINPIICTPASPVVAGTDVTFSTEASDDKALAKLELYIDEELKMTEICSGLTGAISFATDALTVGDHVVRVVATDAAGLVNDISLTVTVQKADHSTCAHANTTVVRTEQYVSINEMQHKLTYTDWTHCLDCDTGISNVPGEDLPEAHEWVNGVCTKCEHECGHDFQLIVDENNENVEVPGSGEWKSYDEHSHYCATIRYVTICSFCGIQGESDTKIAGWLAPHTFVTQSGGTEYDGNRYRTYENQQCSLEACGYWRIVYGPWHDMNSSSNENIEGESVPSYPHEDDENEEQKDILGNELAIAIMQPYYTDHSEGLENITPILGVLVNGLGTIKEEVKDAVRNADGGFDKGREIIHEMVLEEAIKINKKYINIAKDLTKLSGTFAGFMNDFSAEDLEAVYLIGQLSDEEYITLLDGDQSDWGKDEMLKKVWFLLGDEMINDDKAMDELRHASSGWSDDTFGALKAMQKAGKFASIVGNGIDVINTLIGYTQVSLYKDEINNMLDEWIDCCDNEEFIQELNDYKEVYNSDMGIILNTIGDSGLAVIGADKAEDVLVDMAKRGLFGSNVQKGLEQLGKSSFMSIVKSADAGRSAAMLIYEYGFGMDFSSINSNVTKLVSINNVYREQAELLTEYFGKTDIDYEQYTKELRLTAKLAKMEWTYYIGILKNYNEVETQESNALITEYQGYIDIIDTQMEEYIQQLLESRDYQNVIN